MTAVGNPNAFFHQRAVKYKKVFEMGKQLMTLYERDAALS